MILKAVFITTVQNAWEGKVATDLDNFKIRFISPETGLSQENNIL